MTHRKIQKHLSAYLDNELNGQYKSAIESHLHNCDECKQLLSELRENRYGIAKLRQPVPSGIWENVRERMISKQPREHWVFFHNTWQNRFLRPSLAGGGLLALVCIVMAIAYLYPSHNLTEDSPGYYTMDNTAYINLAQSINNVDFEIAGNGDSAESTLPNDTQIFLNVHLGDLGSISNVSSNL